MDSQLPGTGGVGEPSAKTLREPSALTEQGWETIHCCLSISGALKSRKWRKAFTDDNGDPVSDKDVQEFLRDHLRQGHMVIPVGECGDFDWVTGCRGHKHKGESPSPVGASPKGSKSTPSNHGKDGLEAV